MEFSLAFEFPTDNLLRLALALSIVCIFGMVASALLIMHKHSAHRVRQKRQKYFHSLLHGLLESVGDEQDFYINLLNHQIKKYPIDCVYAGVRLVENLDTESKQRYFQIASYLRREDAIKTCLNSTTLEHQCIGLEAIGLGRVYGLKNNLIPCLDHPVLAPYAIEALCSLDGVMGFQQLRRLYEEKKIATSQAITALSKINIDLLTISFAENPNHPLAHFFNRKGI